MSTTQLCRVSRPSVTVQLAGEFDLASVATVAHALANAIGDIGCDLVVDLAEVRFLDASIVRVLVRTHRFLGGRSARLRLRAPSPFIGRVLEICGLGDLVEAGTVPTGSTRIIPVLTASQVPIPA